MELRSRISFSREAGRDALTSVGIVFGTLVVAVLLRSDRGCLWGLLCPASFGAIEIGTFVIGLLDQGA